MTLEMPALKYEHDALEPFISKDTIANHYGVHTKKYFDLVNELVKGTVYEGNPLELLVSKDTMTKMGSKLFNNACQALNHAFYWDCIGPESKSGKPSDQLAEAIVEDFGSFEAFKKEFTESAVAQFGSGWTWLVLNEGRLQVRSTPNAGSPLTVNKNLPLLVCDVWEHAYYLDYQAARAEYVKNFWSYVNWTFVNENFAAVKKD